MQITEKSTQIARAVPYPGREGPEKWQNWTTKDRCVRWPQSGDVMLERVPCRKVIEPYIGLQDGISTVDSSLSIVRFGGGTLD